MPILNYTTQVDAAKSANEVVGILAKHGATTVASFYEQGAPSGVAFTIMTEFGLRDFRLPANAEGVYQAVRNDRTVPPRYKDRAQSQRIAWRILKDWIEAQIALIESGIARLDEVMLPYMVLDGGDTVAVEYQTQQRRLLAIEAAS